MMIIVCLVLLAACTCAEASGCDAPVEEIRLKAGQVMMNALVSENYPNNYPNNVCQKWNIIAEGNRVRLEPPWYNG